MASNENLDSISIAGSQASWIAELTRQEVIAELCNMGVGFNTKDSIERLRRRLHRAILDEEDRKEEEQENSSVPNPPKVFEEEEERRCSLPRKIFISSSEMLERTLDDDDVALLSYPSIWTIGH